MVMARRHRSVSTSQMRKSADGADLLEVQIIGRFDILHHGEPGRSSRNSARLVAYLALHPGMQPRITVASHLWKDVTEARALACLRTALWKTRSDHPRLVSRRASLESPESGNRDDPWTSNNHQRDHRG
jgi:hypothetical protein